tara:strand:- start:947 stop:1753 length:807 start_codon:yes stop_codon:yes gene_type:complete
MENLTVSILQLDLVWENPTKNLSAIERQLQNLGSTDIAVLPEMFSTGFSMDSARLAEQMEGESIKRLKKLSNQYDTAIIGSFICKEASNFYNRLVFIQPDGRIHQYDKRHLFRMAGEDNHFSAGSDRIIINYKGWKILPLVCYDLRFPVWSRNTFEMDRKTFAKPAYDVLIYIANWPSARIGAWDKLLLARAIENQAYVIGVNRVGVDGNDILYSGNSAVIDPKGEYIFGPIIEDEASLTTNLNYKELANFREKFPIGMDADKFKLGI